MIVLRKCRECGLSATYNKELLDFAIDKTLPLGRKNLCKQCHVKLNTARTRERIKENRIKAKEYLGGIYRCMDCGYEHEDIRIFDWHHLNPSEKEYEPSKIFRNTWKKIVKEIDKCVFLCPTCHRIRHL